MVEPLDRKRKGKYFLPLVKSFISICKLYRNIHQAVWQGNYIGLQHCKKFTLCSCWAVTNCVELYKKFLSVFHKIMQYRASGLSGHKRHWGNFWKILVFLNKEMKWNYRRGFPFLQNHLCSLLLYKHTKPHKIQFALFTAKRKKLNYFPDHKVIYLCPRCGGSPLTFTEHGKRCRYSDGDQNGTLIFPLWIFQQ